MAIDSARPGEGGKALRYEMTIDVDSDSTHALVVRLVGWQKRVLELGCSTGYMSAVLQHRGCEVIGVEVDPDAAERARLYCERVIVGDLEQLDLVRELGDDRFDVIVASDVLEHLKNPQRLLRALQPFLRPGGYVVSSIPNIAHGSVRLALLGGDFTYQPVGLLDQDHLRFFTLKSVHSLFEDAGFVLTRLERRLLPIDAAETRFDPATVPTEVLQQLRADRDAQTYQFIVVAHPVAAHQLQAVRRRTRELLEEIDRLKAELERVHTEPVAERARLEAEHTQLIERYAQQIAEHQRVIREYDQRVLDLEAQVAAQSAWAQTSAAAVTERDQTIRSLQEAVSVLDAQVAEAQDAMALLNRELAQRHDAAAELVEQLEGERRQVQQLTATLAQQDAALAEITRSRGWRLLLWLWRLRRLLLPDRSLRFRLLTLPWRAPRATRSEGLTGCSEPPATATALPVTSDAAAATAGRDDGHSVVQALALRDYARPCTYDVVILPIIDWHFRFQRPQQIAVRLARQGHRVLYCSTVLNNGDCFTVRPLIENVLEVQLPGPASTSLYTDQLSEALLARLQQAFAELRDELGMAEAVVLVDLPFWAPLAFKLRERYGWKVVYDCMDHHSGFSTVGETMLRAEDRLSRDSDLVLATSRRIYNVQSQHNPRCLLVPNAADFDHFRFAMPIAPDDIRDVPRPIIGYYGAVSDWLDTALVGRLARARPDWQFVLIGSTFTADLAPLHGLTNVQLLGEKPYHVLPAYLHTFDACIIPFKKNPLTEATNPVKLYEYLSAGKSVVATRLSELLHYSELVALVSSDEEWLAALDQAIQPVPPELFQTRVEFARQNSWDARVQLVTEAVDALYPLTSIILVTYNNEDYTRVCLQSIYEKTVYPNYEILVIDNASHDGTRALLETYQRQHGNFRAVFNDQNKGFAAANNQALGAARGQYVVFLNNDTIVTRGWLTRLLYHLRDPKVGMVGPVTNSSGNESRIEVSYSTIAEMEAFAAEYTRRHFGETSPIGVLPLFCVAMRRAVVDEVGLLDERFGTGMFEDDDYALRVRERGYTLLCAEDVFIHHWGSASFSKLADAKYRALFDENRRKFEEKWGRKWEPHQYRAAKAS